MLISTYYIVRQLLLIRNSTQTQHKKVYTHTNILFSLTIKHIKPHRRIFASFAPCGVSVLAFAGVTALLHALNQLYAADAVALFYCSTLSILSYNYQGVSIALVCVGVRPADSYRFLLVIRTAAHQKSSRPDIYIRIGVIFDIRKLYSNHMGLCYTFHSD